MRTSVLLLMLIIFVACNSIAERSANAQPKNNAADSPATKGQKFEIPTYTVAFRGSQVVPNVTASPLIALPTECASDGTMYLDMIDPSDPRKQTFVGIGDDTTTLFSTTAAFNLHDTTVLGYSVSSSWLGVLLQAKKDAPLLDESGTENKKLNYYIAQYNLDGDFKDSLRLPITGSILRFAIFSSGKFVVMSLAPGHVNATFTVLSRSGTILDVLKTPAFLRASNWDRKANSALPFTSATAFLGSVLFQPYKGDVLMWRSGTVGPIIAIQSDGGERTIPVATPHGYVLSDIVPSNDRLIVHFRPNSAKKAVTLNNSEFVYYEVNPIDGSLMARLMLSNGPSIGTIACEHDGTYISFHAGAHQKLIRSVSR